MTPDYQPLDLDGQQFCWSHYVRVLISKTLLGLGSENGRTSTWELDPCAWKWQLSFNLLRCQNQPPTRKQMSRFGQNFAKISLPYVSRLTVFANRPIERPVGWGCNWIAVGLITRAIRLPLLNSIEAEGQRPVCSNCYISARTPYSSRYPWPCTTSQLDRHWISVRSFTSRSLSTRPRHCWSFEASSINLPYDSKSPIFFKNV